MKSLTNCENTSNNPLPEACTSFPLAACGYKSCRESRPGMYTRYINILKVRDKEILKRNFMQFRNN